jgi:hypothetical protein
LVALASTIGSVNQQYYASVEVEGEQLTLLSGQSIADRHAMLQVRVEPEGVGFGSVIGQRPATVAQVLDLTGLDAEQLSSLAESRAPGHRLPERAGPPSRRPQLAALEAIARRTTQVFNAETMPWQRLRRPHVLKIRSLLEENYLPATGNRMLSALRGVFKECWHSGLIGGGVPLGR